MTNLKTAFSTTAFVLGVAAAAAQPVNDNFANRASITGSSVQVTGTLAGATIEAGEPAAQCPQTTPQASAWWTWTAPTTTRVIISMSLNSWTASSHVSGIDVFSGTNLASLVPLDCNYLDNTPGRYIAFAATAGASYQIRGFGGAASTFGFHLVATDLPLILVAPRDCTNSVYGVAFFNVVAAGSPPPTLQWKFNGSPVPGETNSMLSVFNLSTNAAGVYSVVASNSAGTTESAAMLTVRATDPRPLLASGASGDSTQLAFRVTGETNRWYKIESCSDLEDWTSPGAVLYTNVLGQLSVPKLTPEHQFVRAAFYGAAELCGARMKLWRAAMNLWAIEHRRLLQAGPDFVEIRSYAPGGELPNCPDLGTYAMLLSSTNFGPFCTLEERRGHVMVDPP